MGQAYDAVQRYIDAMKAKDLEATVSWRPCRWCTPPVTAA